LVKAGHRQQIGHSGGKNVKFDFDQIAGGKSRVDGAGAAPKRINQ
jgi:hypothetical protein